MKLNILALVCSVMGWRVIGADDSNDWWWSIPGQCKLPKDCGPCWSYTPSYYFNIQTKRCEKFFYGGCGGNANRFATMDDCRRGCSCSLPPDRGSCRKNKKRWYYNPQVGCCQSFKYGGCFGNENNFVSWSKCKSACGSTVVGSVTDGQGSYGQEGGGANGGGIVPYGNGGTGTNGGSNGNWINEVLSGGNNILWAKGDLGGTTDWAKVGGQNQGGVDGIRGRVGKSQVGQTARRWAQSGSGGSTQAAGTGSGGPSRGVQAGGGVGTGGGWTQAAGTSSGGPSRRVQAGGGIGTGGGWTQAAGTGSGGPSRRVQAGGVVGTGGGWTQAAGTGSGGPLRRVQAGGGVRTGSGWTQSAGTSLQGPSRGVQAGGGVATGGGWTQSAGTGSRGPSRRAQVGQFGLGQFKPFWDASMPNKVNQLGKGGRGFGTFTGGDYFGLQ